MTNVNDFISNNLTEPSRSISAKIFEQGCGFPHDGDILWDNEGNVYRLIETDGRIHTGDNRGNFIFATVEETVSDDEPFEARVEIEDAPR